MNKNKTEFAITLYDALMTYEDAFAVLDSKVRNIFEHQVGTIAALEKQVEELQKTLEQITLNVNTFPPYLKLDEDIPDDKEAAYSMGYVDAIADIAESIKTLKGANQ
jgi:uncharacterized protein YoxC